MPNKNRSKYGYRGGDLVPQRAVDSPEELARAHRARQQALDPGQITHMRLQDFETAMRKKERLLLKAQDKEKEKKALEWWINSEEVQKKVYDEELLNELNNYFKQAATTKEWKTCARAMEGQVPKGCRLGMRGKFVIPSRLKAKLESNATPSEVEDMQKKFKEPYSKMRENSLEFHKLLDYFDAGAEMSPDAYMPDGSTPSDEALKAYKKNPELLEEQIAKARKEHKAALSRYQYLASGHYDDDYDYRGVRKSRGGRKSRRVGGRKTRRGGRKSRGGRKTRGGRR